MINSQFPAVKGDKIYNYTLTESTYIAGSDIEMTDSWQSFTVTVEVTQAYLDNIYAIYDAGEAKAYDLILRLSGLGSAYSNDTLFGYYVDDVAIEKMADATPTVTPTVTAPLTPTPFPNKGVKIEITEGIVDGYPYWRKNSAGYTESMAVNKVITVSYDIYNTSDHEIVFMLMLQNEWRNVDGLTKIKTIPAMSKDTFTIEIRTDGNGNAVMTDGTVICALSAISFRLQLEAGSNMTKGTSFIIAGNGENDPIYGIGNMNLLSSGTTGASTKTVVTSLPNLTVVTPTPVSNKAVVNGDAENGNTGWGVFMGGTTTIVEDPNNSSNHVAYFVPTNKYHSIAFNLAPAILQDASNGYKGAGAGEYQISFRAKANGNGRFNGVINSQRHMSKGATVGDYTLTESTYITGSSIEMTDSWQSFTVTVKVTQAFLDNIYAIYDAGEAKVYDLILRLDGAVGAYRDSAFFGYYVDDVAIKKTGDAVSTATPTVTATPTATPTVTATPAVTATPTATATPTVTAAPTPNAIEVHALQETVYYLLSSTGIMDTGDIKNGVLKKEITFENVGENDISVQLCIQAMVQKPNGGATWAGFNNEEGFVRIPVGEKKTITVEVPFESNGVTIIFDQEVTVDKLFFRINFNDYTLLNAGDGVLIYGDQDIVNAFATKISTDKITYEAKTINIDTTPDLTEQYGSYRGMSYRIFMGEVTILSADASLTGHVVIPANINGYPVTGIADSAFYCSGISSIGIPSTVKKIGRAAFKHCDNLNAVYIFDIAAWCNIDFYDEGYFWNDANPLYYANRLYLNGELVTNLVIPEGVTEIKPYAFAACAEILSITLPDSLRVIGKCAFAGCTSLTEIRNGDNLENIDENALFISEYTGWVGPFYFVADEMQKDTWQDDKYLGSDGKLVRNAWVGEYYMDENGNMVKNAWQDEKYLGSDGRFVRKAWIGEYYVDINGNMVKNAWQDEKYLGSDGKLVKSQWVGEYYVDGNGNMVRNAWQDDKYLGSDGRLVKSQWVDEYYVDGNGNMVKNAWQDDKYLGSDGRLVKSQWVGEYYVDGNGNIVKNTWRDNKYLGADGRIMRDRWIVSNGKWYYVNGDGNPILNEWKLDTVGWCYLTADGSMAVNMWIADSQGWCYVGSDGYCVIDEWMKDSVGWVYLDSSGRMATNMWLKDSLGWCFVGSDGYCVTNEWMKDSVGWVYLDSNGRMLTNAWTMDSVGWCYVGSDGYAITNSWMADSVGWCYLDSEGRMVVNGWVQDSNGWCWLDESGYWNGVYA